MRYTVTAELTLDVAADSEADAYTEAARHFKHLDAVEGWRMVSADAYEDEDDPDNPVGWMEG